MCSLHKVINFRANISKLNDTEFDILLNKIYTSYNRRDLLSESFFHLLVYQSKQNKLNKDLMVDNINKSITNIIDLRTKKESKNKNKNDNIKPIPISFNICPSSLISLICTYLQLSETINFKVVSRNIYISISSTPTSITSIHRRMWLYRFQINYGQSQVETNNQMNKLNTFKMIKNVGLTAKTIIDIQSVKKYPKCLLFLWQNLNQFTLTNIDFDPNENGSYGTQSQSSNVLFNTIESFKFNHLKLYQINMHQCISFNPLIKLICSCLNICGMTQLSLNNLQQGMRRITNGDFNKLNHCKLNINALSLYQMSNDVNSQILSVIAHKLESLHVVSDEINEVLPINNNNNNNNNSNLYCMLKEVCLYNVDINSIKYVINASGNRLERLHLCGSLDVNWNDLVKIMLYAYGNNLNLQYLCVEIMDTNQVGLFMNTFVECLNKKVNINKRKQFKLRLNFDIDNLITQYFTSKLMTILSAFKSNIENFSLIMYSSFIKGTFDGFEHFIQQIKNDNKYQVIVGMEDVVVDDDGDEEEAEEKSECWIRHITISNKHCCMNSFNENWIMECGNCQQFMQDSIILF